MRKKLRDCRGMSMVEVLCAVVLLVLLVLMMNTGIHMAVKNYRVLTSESETQLLLSSLSDALADKLRYAVVTEITIEGGEQTEYMCTIDDSEMPITDGTAIKAIHADENGIVVMDVKKRTGANIYDEAGTTKKLLPDGAYGKIKSGSSAGERSYGVDSLEITYNKDNNSFDIKLSVTDENLGITQKAELTVRCLSPVKTVREGTTA